MLSEWLNDIKLYIRAPGWGVCTPGCQNGCTELEGVYHPPITEMMSVGSRRFTWWENRWVNSPFVPSADNESQYSMIKADINMHYSKEIHHFGFR